jgi:poly-gamma-glutamate synthesis protein (capsule biosynthesis protein)
MFSRAVRSEILESGDAALPFRKIAPLMAGADIAFVNLESPFSNEGPYPPEGLVFHAAPEMISGLELAHIAVVSTANNHARDCGSHGVEFTVAWLRQHGMGAVGSGQRSGADPAWSALWVSGVHVRPEQRELERRGPEGGAG